MAEPTATNPQTGEKIVFRNGQWLPMTGAPPAAPTGGPVYGAPVRPAQPSPPSDFTVGTDARDYDFKVEDRTFDRAGKLRTEFIGLPDVRQFREVRNATRQIVGLARGEGSAMGDLGLVFSYMKALDPGSTVREGEQATAQNAAGIPTQIRNAYNKLVNGERLAPEQRQDMATVAQSILASRAQGYNDIAQTYRGLFEAEGLDPDKHGITIVELAAQAAAEQGASGSDGGRWPGVVGQDGKPLPPEGGYGLDPETGEWGLYGGNTDDSPLPPSQAETIANDPRLAEPDAAVLARQGFTLGLSDEAAGIGGAIGNALQLENPIAGYRLWRDVERAQIERARGNMGGMGTAIEVGSGFGGIGTGANAMLTLGQAAKQGAGIGALGGFGYGEGAEGSAINALAGGALGAGLGAGGQRIGSALGGMAANRATATADRAQRAQALQQAGQAEGVNVNRAMADPALANRVTGVDASRVAGAKFQRGMDEIEGQIEGRIDALAGGRTAPSREAVGDLTQDALDRGRTLSGQQTRALYTRAEKLAGDVQVTPTAALAEIDNQIAELTASGPNANSGLIKYLNDVKADLSRGGLSIQALRAQRTSLRGQINERSLTHSDAERRMGLVLDAASEDITQALSGNPRALQAYRTADSAYRERSQFTRQVMARLVGPEDNRLSGEATGRKIESWLKDDAGRFRRLWDSFEQGERDEIGAYVAGSLGRNSKGEFSLAHFLNNTGGKNRTVSDRSLRLIFGDDGFQSIQNLRTLATEANRVAGAMNSRKSGTAVGNDYRSWLSNLLIGGGGGAALDIATTGGATATTAALGAATAAGVKAGRDLLNARLLLSPKITRWALQAPRTQSPQAIDRHFERLADIARAEPALAGDIEMLRNAIMQAANDNPAARLAAEQQNANEN